MCFQNPVSIATCVRLLCPFSFVLISRQCVLHLHVRDHWNAQGLCNEAWQVRVHYNNNYGCLIIGIISLVDYPVELKPVRIFHVEVSGMNSNSFRELELTLTFISNLFALVLCFSVLSGTVPFLMEWQSLLVLRLMISSIALSLSTTPMEAC